MAHDAERLAHRELAAAAAGGDRAASEELLGALYDRVHGVCRRICGNAADAEDATQEAMISIARGLRAFDGRAAVTTWAYRIATNAALDELRRRGRRPSPVDPDLHPESIGDAPTDVERLGDRLDLDAALRAVPLDFRVAVVLRDVAGLEHADIAAHLDVPVGTVRSRIARGRRHLADLLDLGNRPAAADVRTDEP